MPGGSDTSVLPAPPYATGAPSGAQRPRRGPWIPLLAGVSGLLLVLSVALGGLLFAKSGDLGESRTTVSSQREQLREKDSKIVSLEGERDKAREELDGSKDQVGTLTEDKATIATCLKLVLRMFEAAGNGNRSQVDALLKQMDVPCTKAEGLVA